MALGLPKLLRGGLQITARPGNFSKPPPALTFRRKLPKHVLGSLPLMNDAFVVVFADKIKGQPSEIIAVDLFIKDAAFTQYETDRLPATGTPSPGGFTIEVGEPEANVYVGKTGAFVGTICVGDLDFTPTS